MSLKPSKLWGIFWGARWWGGWTEFEKEISSISRALDDHNNAYFETSRRVDVF